MDKFKSRPWRTLSLIVFSLAFVYELYSLVSMFTGYGITFADLSEDGVTVLGLSLIGYTILTQLLTLALVAFGFIQVWRESLRTFGIYLIVGVLVGLGLVGIGVTLFILQGNLLQFDVLSIVYLLAFSFVPALLLWFILVQCLKEQTAATPSATLTPSVPMPIAAPAVVMPSAPSETVMPAPPATPTVVMPSAAPEPPTPVVPITPATQPTIVYPATTSPDTQPTAAPGTADSSASPVPPPESQ